MKGNAVSCKSKNKRTFVMCYSTRKIAHYNIALQWTLCCSFCCACIGYLRAVQYKVQENGLSSSGSCSNILLFCVEAQEYMPVNIVT